MAVGDVDDRLTEIRVYRARLSDTLRQMGLSFKCKRFKLATKWAFGVVVARLSIIGQTKIVKRAAHRQDKGDLRVCRVRMDRMARKLHPGDNQCHRKKEADPKLAECNHHACNDIASLPSLTRRRMPHRVF